MRLSAVVWALAGGALIGTAASGLLLLNGRLAGISGIAAGLLAPGRGEVGWRFAFVLGLLAGGGLLLIGDPSAFPAHPAGSLTWLALSGFLVGVGTRIGNGCTSGHGVCGLSRRSARSLAAMLTFMAAGMVTVYVVRHVLAWSAA